MNEYETGQFTKNEILSQPESWKTSLEQLHKDWNGRLPHLKQYDEIIFTGCGSTFYQSIWASRLLQGQKGISSRSLPASEIWFATKDWMSPYKKPLLIAISRSGETTETLHAVEEFKKLTGGEVICITCYPESQLPKMASLSLNVPAGQEKSVAQTRSFSNMMLAVLALVNGSVSDDLPAKLSSLSQNILDRNLDQAISIGRNKELSRFFYLGNGPLFGLANEVMLKMKEMSLSYSEAFHFMEFRHGPMSMVDDQSLIVGLLSPSKNKFEYPVLNDMRKLGGSILAIGNTGNNSFDRTGIDFDLPAESLGIWVYPLYLPLLQMMSYERSLSKGLNPDKPTNLTAVVELE